MQQELKLSVLITWDGQGSTVHSHVAALPSRPQPPVKVQVYCVPVLGSSCQDIALMLCCWCGESRRKAHNQQYTHRLHSKFTRLQGL